MNIEGEVLPPDEVVFTPGEIIIKFSGKPRNGAGHMMGIVSFLLDSRGIAHASNPLRNELIVKTQVVNEKDS